MLCSGLDDGTFDAGRARALARELFAIYGVEVVPDVPRRDGERSALIDGLAFPAKLGFELRGCGVRETRGEALPKHEDTTASGERRSRCGPVGDLNGVDSSVATELTR